MKRFALTGVSGYVAPRHLRAIHETGNHLVAALDPSDSAGILDTYFPDCSFFTEFERFDRHLEKLRRGANGGPVDFLSVCSPNYLHDAHVRLALRLGADAICEKPLVLNPWNVDALEELEQEFGRRVWAILQLRHHPAVQGLQRSLSNGEFSARPHIELTYITARGRWYQQSWKGQEAKSGGVATNIGIHLFDLLSSIFGPALEVEVHVSTPTVSAGRLELERATVEWFLSIEASDLPVSRSEAGARTYRLMAVDGASIPLDAGFENLHSEAYRQILAGRGLGLSNAKTAIDLVHTIRTTPVTKPEHRRCHPLVEDYS